MVLAQMQKLNQVVKTCLFINQGIYLKIEMLPRLRNLMTKKYYRVVSSLIVNCTLSCFIYSVKSLNFFKDLF